jgi:hypothetical protein
MEVPKNNGAFWNSGQGPSEEVDEEIQATW